MKVSIRRILTINDTKIKYLSVADKIYKVTNIDFHRLAIKASETDLSIADYYILSDHYFLTLIYLLLHLSLLSH